MKRIEHHIKICFAAFALLMGAVSCLDKFPGQSIPENGGMQNYNDAEQHVVGIYSRSEERGPLHGLSDAAAGHPERPGICGGKATATSTATTTCGPCARPTPKSKRSTARLYDHRRLQLLSGPHRRGESQGNRRREPRRTGHLHGRSVRHPCALLLGTAEMLLQSLRPGDGRK